MPLQKIKHNPTSNKKERQSQIKYRANRSDMASMLSNWLGLHHPKHVNKGGSSHSLRGEDVDKASMLSNWLGLHHPKHVNKGGSSHSLRGEDVDKGGASHPLRDEDEHAGPMTLTVARANTEAAMKGKMMDQHHNAKHHHRIQSFEDDGVGVFDTYVNSNCQGINNSIMLNASYTSNDPGVHVNIEEPHDDQRCNKNESNLNDTQKM